MEMGKIIFRKWAWIPVLLLVCLISSCNSTAPSYQDLSHYSKVFGKEKPFRVYLPSTYSDSVEKEYPVIYYLHGWGGTHMKDSSNMAYDSVGKLVDKYQAIMVLLNGRMDDDDPRPYNMGYHEHMTYKVQMKDYFPEIVTHIDSTYRTQNSRYGRALMGFSMGGMMTTYLSGKYPDKIGAAVDLCGSVEFYLGMPDNHTFYPLRYTFANIKDVPFRLRNSSHGELSALNRETNNGALWEGLPDYDYWTFEGGHEVDSPGKTETLDKAFSFLLSTLHKEIPPLKSWSHYELYDQFDLWGYHVESNKERPGLLYLSNVSKSGFGFRTYEWLPNGPALEGITAKVTTAPIYEPQTAYVLTDFDQKTNAVTTKVLNSDAEGRLQVEVDGAGHEFGIYKQGDGPKPTFLGYALEDGAQMLRVGQSNELQLKLANLGEAVTKKEPIEITLSSRDTTVVFQPTSLMGEVLENGEIRIPATKVWCSKTPPADGSPFGLKLHLKMELENSAFEDEFYMPVFFNVPAFDTLDVDDGRMVQDTLVGKGNGNAVVEAGEQIMLYTNGHRLQLYYDDPYIVGEKLFDEVLPAEWQTDGVTFSSIVNIAKDCPKGHHIKLLAKYETKAWNPIARSVYWGTVDLVVGEAFPKENANQ